MEPSLASAFVAHLPACFRSDEDKIDHAALEQTLREIVSSAQATWPGLSVDQVAFLKHLGSCVDSTVPMPEALSRVRTNDLWLAFACSTGSRLSGALLEEHCISQSDGMLRKRGISEDVMDEAKQNVRERLLVGKPLPKILDFDGRGPLKQWVRVVLIREAILLSKKTKKDEPLTYDLLTMPANEDSPEMAYFKSRYRSEYKEAFECALSKLSARERTLLRQQYIMGLGVDEIGEMYRVHRATAARWVESARETLWANARLELVTRLGLSRNEIENIVTMIQSQLHVSLERLLELSRSSQK